MTMLGMSSWRRPTNDTRACALFTAFLRLTCWRSGLSATSDPTAWRASVDRAASRAVRLLCAASVCSTLTSSLCRALCQNSTRTWASEVPEATPARAVRLRLGFSTGASEEEAAAARLDPFVSGSRRWRARRRISSPPYRSKAMADWTSTSVRPLDRRRSRPRGWLLRYTISTQEHHTASSDAWPNIERQMSISLWLCVHMTLLIAYMSTSDLARSMATDSTETDVILTGELLYTSRTVDVMPKRQRSVTSEVSASARAHGFTALEASGFTTKTPSLRSRYLHSAMASDAATTWAAAAWPMDLQLMRLCTKDIERERIAMEVRTGARGGKRDFRV